jgi:hypothetical protein
MKYVKIVSKSVTTPEDMFTLGVSTSRGKADKIGQFGSGTLLGTLAWMRAYGTSPIFMINGKKVVFETKEILKSDGEPFKQVLMCHSRKKAPLNVALEYGTLDWPTACLGLREWISNAIDGSKEGTDPKTLITLTNKIEASDDEVAVFVPYTDLAKEYFDNIGKYFLHFVGKQKNKVVEKDTVSKCRIYRKGVFIRELKEDSLFDYNMNFDINECRTGSSDSLLNSIEYHITYYEQDDTKLRQIRDSVLANLELVETGKTYNSLSDSFTEVWRELVGKVGLCPSNFTVANCTAIAPIWHKSAIKAVPELDGLKEVCEAEIKGFLISPPSEAVLKHYHNICELIETVGLSGGMSRPKLIMYNTKDNNHPGFLGLYSTGKQEVMLWEKNKKLSETMVHELAHHYTGGADDYTSEFAKFGHDLVAAIVNKLM